METKDCKNCNSKIIKLDENDICYVCESKIDITNIDIKRIKRVDGQVVRSPLNRKIEEINDKYPNDNTKAGEEIYKWYIENYS